ncbi:type I polyketide synthase [Dactylosporangium sp. CA-152071]|uniref:type I polyketide synthase n=1 Tax=Dactylosporangium sp. CA-152071 TaxID=3239933 RepID=UPI003D8B793B
MLHETEERGREPVAIVGMACRFPGGVSSPDDLWDLVRDGRDGTSEFPDDRGWDLANLFDDDPDAAGKSYARRGGFVDGIAEFDAGFFGISPREAVAMDPQQRLLLETSWEAIERAGVDPLSLRGTRTGVYIGAGDQGYAADPGDVPEGAEGYLLTGNANSVVSGRVSYVLGLEGPAMTVDTACSSSLVALHLAVQAVRQDECEFALTGGVSLLSSPGLFIGFSRQRGLAPDGRCKSFAEAADGTGWAEGVGVLMIERLSTALAAGRRVLAVIRGSATNQDGASSGLSTPNGPSQQRVIQQALANARLSSQDVDLVEAHGTGTVLGDPIEAQALQATYGAQRPPDRPLLLGSVKSNIGHTQAASGVAGVIKAVMALQHATVPRTLHVDAPTAKVDWSAGTLQLVTGTMPWPSADRPRRAAVSSFGISGTNAHVIVEQAPVAQEAPVAGGAGPMAWVLSGRTDLELRAQAARLAAVVDREDRLRPQDVAYTLAAGRPAFRHRAAVVGEQRDDLRRGLAAIAAGETPAGVVEGIAFDDASQVVFVFPGQGSQWDGMALELLDQSPVFRARMDECAAALAGLVDWSVVDVLRGTAGAPSLDRVDVLQPALFAVMVSLASTWTALGVRPAAVVGHSQGEVAAACVAGALTLPDAARITVLRSRMIASTLSGHGGMMSVPLPAADVTARLEAFGGHLSIAAVNGPASVVVSGDPHALTEFMRTLEAQGRSPRTIPVDYASHSAHVEAIREPLLEALRPAAPGPLRLPLFSTVDTDWADGPALDSGYWYRNLRRPVQFGPAVTALLDAGYGTFVEVSPHPVLTGAIQDTIEQFGRRAVALGTLRRNEGGMPRLLSALATAHVNGATPDWPAVLAGTDPRPADLPTYPFQRRRFWLASGRSLPDPARLGFDPVGHPLLGAAIRPAGTDGLLFTGRVSLRTHPWLADHSVLGSPLVPGALFVELVMRAGDEVGCDRIDELTVETPLVLPDDREVSLQVRLAEPAADGTREAGVYSRSPDGDTGPSWIRHASATLSTAPAAAARSAPYDGPPAGAVQIDPQALYAGYAAAGIHYGPVFRGLRSAWRLGEEVVAEVALASQERERAGEFGLHPALLDAAAQAAALLAPSGDAGTATRLAFAWNGVRLHTSGAAAAVVRLSPAGPDRFRLTLSERSGQPVVTVESLVLRTVEGESLIRSAAHPPELFDLAWVDAAAGPDEPDGTRRAVLGPDPLGLFGELGLPGHADVAAVAAEGADLVLAACPADGVDGAAALAAATHALRLVQDWLAEERLSSTRLVVVTHRAVATGPAEAPDPASAAVWGLVRSAQAENPDRLLLLDVERPLTALPPVPEAQAAIRDGKVLVPRIVRAEPGPADPAWDPDGTVLLTGATGGLGPLVARHLVTRHGVRHLILLSRQGPAAAGVTELAAELTDLGAVVTVVAGDVGDRSALQAVIQGVGTAHPLRAVVHAAAVVDDAIVASLSPQQLEAVFRSKVDGAAHLHELTTDHELTAFVLFSSAAGTFGGPGQGSYAAANAYLDALAQRRRAAGLAGTSLAWGPWEETGGLHGRLAASDTRRMARGGIGVLATGEALALLDAATGRPAALALPIRLDLDACRAQARAGTMSPLLRAVVPLPVRRQAAGDPGDGGTDERGRAAVERHLAGLSPTQRHEVMLGLVREHAAAVLGHESSAAVEPGRRFKDLGFDSLTAVELRNRLKAATGLQLPATLVFDYPTAEELAGRVLAGLGHGDTTVHARTAPVAADEPIAIVGMGCRLPGGISSPEELWQLLVDGGDAISELPADRGWDLAGMFDEDPDAPGKSYARFGGFIDGVADFDAGFFGISPREALAMDPQQRLLLEASWEALERAGIDPLSLKGSQTGVFVGTSGQDYAVWSTGATESLETYLATSNSASVLSGRIAYTLGLEGPAVTVDTACSSSLVALHLAAQALRRGECDLAVVGGATVMAGPGVLIGVSRQQGLSVDGRCKAFAEGADGTGLSEGVGVLVLQRASVARRPLAVVRGSAVNQDGASNGLTAPSGKAQERVLRSALGSAGFGPEDVDVVEGHGTGTRLGDPIEVGALLEVFGGRGGAPLLLGSVKSNVGHTQAAAGVVGVMKMVLALEAGVVPASLHVGELSSVVDWSVGGVEVVRELADWPVVDRVRRAGVSSFGVSGTNAHVILEQAPELPEPERDAVVGPVAWVLSGRSREALRDQIVRLREFVSPGDGVEVGDVAVSLAERSVFAERAVVVGSEAGEFVAGLDAVAAAVPSPDAVAGTARPARGRTVFVFPGQGGQWAGMGRDLMVAEPVFRDTVEACAAVLADLVDWSLLDVLRDDGTGPSLERADVVQPVSFAVMVGLAAVWQSYGVRPDVVIGHSQGEIAAAFVAGALSLADAMRVVVLRSRLAAQSLSGLGLMAAVALPPDDAAALLGRWDARLSLAAVNGPSSVIVSGEPEAVEELLAVCAAEDIRHRRLAADYASHCAQVEVVRDQLLEGLATLAPLTPQIPFFSTTDRQWLDSVPVDANYWYRNLRQTVHFSSSIAPALDGGPGIFIEVSPHPVLVGSIEETIEQDRHDAVAIGTLRRDQGGPDRILLSLGEAFVHGTAVDWPHPTGGARRLALPTYAFQHRRYWLEGRPGPASATADADGPEQRFWSAVEQEDLTALTDALQIDADGDGAPLAAALPVLSSWRRRQRKRSAADSWLYRTVWKQIPDRRAADLTGSWLLVIPDGQLDDPWIVEAARGMAGRGARITRLTLPGGAPDRAGIAARLAETPAVDHVLTFLAFADQPHPEHPVVPLGLAGNLALVQALEDAGVDAPVWFATRSAMPARPADRLTGCVQAQIWGFGQVLGLEQPERLGGLVDLPDRPDPSTVDRLVAILAGAQRPEDQLAVRTGGTYARRLQRAARNSDPGTEWRPSGTVLVTGGTGALGAHVARWLADRGADHVVLASRTGEAPQLQAELVGRGVRVTVARCDVAHRPDLERLLAEHPPAAIVHAAGVVDDATIDSLTVQRLAGVAGPKVAALTHLDELTRRLPLTAFIVFSSAASTLGSPGQANYAAANSFMDAVVERRRAEGLCATSIAWGAWGGDNRATQGDAADRVRRTGLVPMAPEIAVDLLGAPATIGTAVLTVADIRWSAIVSGFSAVRPRPLFDDLPEVRAVLDAQESGEERFVQRLAAMAEAEQSRAVLDLVMTHTAAMLGYDGPEAIQPDRAFRELGFDSLTAVELRNHLGGATELRLPATLVFDHPTPSALAGELRRRLLGEPDAAGPDNITDIDIRRLIESIPPQRLRESGLITELLRLRGPAEAAPPKTTAAEHIDAMEVGDLLQMARETLGP